MTEQGLMSTIVDFIETLPDRPFMLFLFIAAGAVLFFPLSMLLRKAAAVTVDTLFPEFKGGKVKKLAATLYAGADMNGVRDGIRMEVDYSPVVFEGRVTAHEIRLKYEVSNPLGIRMVIHRSGPLHRPLESLPPETVTPPSWLAEEGFVLRCAPPREAAGLDTKIEPLIPVLHDENLDEIRLEGDALSISLSSTAEWPDEAVTKLAEAGLSAAKHFN